MVGSAAAPPETPPSAARVQAEFGPGLEEAEDRGETRAAVSDEAPPSSAAPLVRAPVIGREGELALLKQIYDSVLARSETRVATLVGPTGIGKTRVAEQLLDDLPVTRHPRVYRGTARAQSLAYGLFDSLLRSRFDLAEGLPAE